LAGRLPMPSWSLAFRQGLISRLT